MNNNIKVKRNYSTPGSLLEGINTEGMTSKELMAIKKLHNYIVESANIAIEENVPLDDVIDEGLLGSLAGMVSGVTLMPVIMKAVCSVLGITEKGVLYDLLTSKVVLAAMGAKLGMRI